MGPGRDSDFAGKDVTGKIVLGNASVTSIFNSAVNQRGAAGALGHGSAGFSANAPGYTLDQIGWQSVSPQPGKTGVGFVLSLRQFNELRDLHRAGHEGRDAREGPREDLPAEAERDSATIPGTDASAGSLLFVAHAFERPSTPGANDNASGVGTTLEMARTLARARQGRPPATTAAHAPIPVGAGDLRLASVHVQVSQRCRTSCSRC